MQNFADITLELRLVSYRNSISRELVVGSGKFGRTAIRL